MRKLKNSKEALEKYLFYRNSRDAALGVLRQAILEYSSGILSEDQIYSFEDDLEILYNELDQANKIINDVELVH